MVVLYLLTLLMLSSAHRLLAEYDNAGHFQPRLEHRADGKGVLEKAVKSDDDIDESLKNADRMQQDETSDENNDEGTNLNHDFDDGNFTQARVTIKSMGTDTYGGFSSMNKSKIFAESPHLIAARSTVACKFPTDLKESELDCTTYPSKVVCIQTCMFGYTLPNDGIRRRMECFNDENRWKPVAEFEKCKPFVDCGVTIGPGGSYKCRKNYMHKGADCDVACSPYEDKEAVPMARYECDINGNWTPQLPFCAKPGSGLKLVPVPHGAKQISNL